MRTLPCAAASEATAGNACCRENNVEQVNLDGLPEGKLGRRLCTQLLLRLLALTSLHGRVGLGILLKPPPPVFQQRHSQHTFGGSILLT